MKPLAGLLVEYLVIGAVALLWLVPLLGKYQPFTDLITSKDNSATIIALALPAIYVVGMVCDLLGYVAVRKLPVIKRGKKWISLKEKINTKVWEKENLKNPGSQLIQAYAICYEPKLADEIEARSSRDRIARGAFVAFLPAIFFNWTESLLAHFGIVLFVICCLAALWYRYQELSSKYEAKAWRILQDKHGLSSKANAKEAATEGS